MLQDVFIVFMAFVSLVCLFIVLVVARDILRERHGTDKVNTQEPEKNTGSESEGTEAPVSEDAVATVSVMTEAAEPPVSSAEENSVSFTPGAALTLEDKFMALSARHRKFYTEIAKYAENVPGSKCFKNTRYEEYKLKKNRLVRLLIKKGIVTCEFLLPNADYKFYISENHVDVKLAATVLKVEDAAAVQFAKDSIDIAVKAFEEEQALKKQMAREKRKADRAENADKGKSTVGV